MKRLNVAILGQGRSGRDIHGQFLLTATEKFRIAYAVDPVPERRERAEKEYGCEALADYAGLFGKNDVDFVVNAAPSHFHVPVTLDLLDRGFNVLCEKPFARTVEEVDRMIAKAKERGVMLAVFQQSRFAPYFEKILEVIGSGVLGRLIQVSVRFNGFARRWDWQTLQENVGGSLYNTGPHPVDQALTILNYPQGDPNVVCYMDRVNTFGDAEDYCKLILTAPDRPVVDVEISSCDAYPTFTYRIMGSAGGLTGGTTELRWRWFVREEAPEQKLVRTPLHHGDWLPQYCSEPLVWREDQWSAGEDATFTYGTGKLYDTVYDNLTRGEPLVVTPEQVRRQIRAMEEAHRQNPMSRIG